MSKPEQAPGLLPKPVAVVVALVVSGLWGYDVLRSLLDATHQLNGTLGTAFSIVMGALFAQSRLGKPGQPPEDAPAEQPAPLPEGAVTAADLIARLQAERRGEGR